MVLENNPNFYLVRHAESMQNVNQNLDRDSSLSELGKKQAVEAGFQLKEILAGRQLAVIVHTGLRRTLDTAQAIKKSGKISTDLIEIPEFREREMGIYDQVEFSDLIARNPHMEAHYQKYKESCVWFFDGNPQEGVEPLEEMKVRVVKGLNRIYELYQDKLVLIVAHAGSVKMIRMIYEVSDDTNIADYLSSYIPKNCEIYIYSAEKIPDLIQPVSAAPDSNIFR